MSKCIGIAALTMIICAGGLMLNERLSLATARLISTADASTNRAISPMSIQGAAARTVRVCSPGTHCPDSDRGRDR